MTDEERRLARSRKLRRLKNVDVKEVSLVDSPANLRNFLLFKRQGAPTTDVTAAYDEELINHDFNNVLTPEEQIEFLERMKKLAAKIDALEMANLSPIQKAALLDTLLLEEAMVRLYKRDPGLYQEFSKATTEELQKDWCYERDARGVPIIQKRLKRTYGPGETATHKFGELPDGRYGWMPKRKRDPQGRYTEGR